MREILPRFMRKARPALAGMPRWVALLACALSVAGLALLALPFLKKEPPAVLTVGLGLGPPFMFRNERGEAAGAIPELLNEAAARSGITLRWVDHPRGADSAMTPGSGIDLWPLAEVTAARRKRFHITQPYARGDMLLVRLEGQAGRPIRTLGLRDWPEVRDWARRTYPGARAEVRGQGSGMLRLCEGTLDATLVETPVFDAFLMRRPDACANNRFQITLLNGFGTEYGIASTFRSSKSADLLRHSLGEMAREGALDEIFQRYYPLAHYRSAESFAETETEKSSRLLRWGASALFVICVLLWITAQKFRRRADETRAMADLRSRFLARISHEFRTPLNGVLGIASVLSATSLDRTQREYVELIRSSGETLLRTVNEVLDFSRLEAGKHSLTCAPVQIECLVEDVISILAPVAYQKDLELAWTVERDVPAAIQSDATALRQILMNLLGNALKFTARGFVTLTIRHVAINPEAAIVRILVSDSGPGIPAGQEEDIFNPYTRGADAATQAQVGTGLGLSITKQLVILLGGTVHVANDPFGGCTFTVDLPATPVSESAAPPPQRFANVSLPQHTLLLTRRDITGDMLERRLLEKGGRVSRRANAESALAEVAAGERWDLLVIDAGLDGDCLELAGTLRRSQGDSTAPVLFLTTGKQSTDALLRRIPDEHSVFPKPFLSELFASALERLTAPPGSRPASIPAESGTSARPLEAGGFPLPPPAASSTGLLELQRATRPPAIHLPGHPEKMPVCEICAGVPPRSCKVHAAEPLPLTSSTRVLVADDNPVNLKVLTSLLRTMGISCDAAGSGEEALGLFAATAYSWVIMDWHMPGMDGLTAIRAIRKRERSSQSARTPIILCTATSEQDARQAAGEDTFDVALPKPISLHSLRKALIVSARRAGCSLRNRPQAPSAGIASHPAAPQG